MIGSSYGYGKSPPGPAKPGRAVGKSQTDYCLHRFMGCNDLITVLRPGIYWPSAAPTQQAQKPMHVANRGPGRLLPITSSYLYYRVRWSEQSPTSGTGYPFPLWDRVHSRKLGPALAATTSAVGLRTTARFPPLPLPRQPLSRSHHRIHL